MPGPEMDGEHSLVGRIEIVERNKLGGRGLDPVPAFGRELAFVREVRLGVEAVLRIGGAVVACFF